MFALEIGSKILRGYCTAPRSHSTRRLGLCGSIMLLFFSEILKNIRALLAFYRSWRVCPVFSISLRWSLRYLRAQGERIFLGWQI